MMHYETGILSLADSGKFIKFFEREIGTEFDFNSVDIDQYYIVFFDLTKTEADKIREYERNLDKQENDQLSSPLLPFVFNALNMRIPDAISSEMNILDVVDKTSITSYTISHDPEYDNFIHTFKTSENINNIKALVSFMKAHVATGDICTGDVYAVDRAIMAGADLMDFL